MTSPAALTLLVALALSSPARADSGSEAPPLPRTARLGVAAGYGGPLGPFAGPELLIGPGADVWVEGEGVSGLAGLLVQLQAGRDGARLSVGVGAHADIRTADFRGPVALALKGSLVHLWDEPGRRGTWMGPEIALSVWHLETAVGFLHRLDRPRRMIVSFSMAARF